MGDKNIAKKPKKHPSNEKQLASNASKAAANKASEALAAAKPGAKPNKGK